MISSYDISQVLQPFLMPINNVSFGVQLIGNGVVAIADAIKYYADKQVEVAQINADALYVNETHRLRA